VERRRLAAKQATEKVGTGQEGNNSGAKALIKGVGDGPTKSRALIQNMSFFGKL
jgi:hypothetical protein